MITYKDFYNHFGIRRAMQLVAPPMIPLARLVLPQESILHYLPTDANNGISADDPLLRGAMKPVWEEHILRLADKRGAPRSSMVSPSKLIRDYHRKYKSIRQLHDLDRILSNKNALIVENYGMLPQLYRYPSNIYRTYSKWWNIQATLWHRVAELAANTHRQQFLECRLPPMLPSRAALIKGSGKLTTRTLSLFPESESLFILELWKWLNGHKSDTVFASVPDEALKRVNLVWIENGRWAVLNMGLLDSWRSTTKDEEERGVPKRKGLNPLALANRFIRLLMFLYESRTSPGTDHPLTDKVELTEENDDGQEVLGVSAAPVTIDVPTPYTDEKEEEATSEKITLEPGVDLSNLPIDQIEETEENNRLIDEIVTKDLEALDELHLMRERELLNEEDASFDDSVSGLPEPMLEIPELKDISLKEGVMAKADQLADMGLLSGAEYRRMQALSEAYTKLPDPYGSNKTLEEAFTISTEEIKVEPIKLTPNEEGIVDKSMLYSTLADWDPKYIKETLPKHIGQCVLGAQKGGIAVTSYQVREHQDAMNHYVHHTVQFTPVRGKPSTWNFRIPKVNPDGVFIANGVKYRLSKQRSEDPIRKVDESTVALTSYYGKVFVQRSEKKVADYAGWLSNQIAVRAMDPQNTEVVEAMLANVHDSNNRVPRVYSTLAMRFRNFDIGDYHFLFDYEARDTLLPEDVKLSSVEGKRWTLVGRTLKGKQPIVVDHDNTFYKAVKEDNGYDYQVIGTIEEMLGLDTGKAPKEYAEIKILGKLIPVGIFLAYQVGFEGLLALLNVQPARRVQQGEHAKLTAEEFMITFEDEKLVFFRNSRKDGLILQGLASWNDILANYPMHFFNKKAIYFNVLERMKLGVRYLREMDMLVDLFIDPITKDRLVAFKEPVTFAGLLLRAGELLENDWSLDATDFNASRIRGYERFAGAVYSEIVKAIRVQRSRGTAAAPVEIHPNAVWKAINDDSAVRLLEESNPIHDLKGQEEVTFSGTGGRSGRSMVADTRRFHPNDMGVISEATKDSADVSITTYLTANPQVTDVYGSTERFKKGKTGAASLLSTSALMAPCSDREDLKRTGFTSIQNSSTTFTLHQKPLPLRTGYERILPHRVSDLYAYTAKGEGTITKVTPRVVEVTYKDGTVKTVQIGTRYGKVAGMVLPHRLESAVKEGDKVKPGDAVAFNSHYFQLDRLDKSQLLYKGGVLFNTALMDTPDTLEDSCTISERVAKLLETQITEIREIEVGFDQSIHGLVRPGDVVEADSILCTIEDPITADSRLFDESSLDTLKLLAANTPRAKIAGTVEKIEVFYNGDIDDLSPSLQELALESDSHRKRLAREMRETFTSGRVDDSLRVGGNPLLTERAVVRVYISATVPAGSGDKAVFGNQLKTIIGRVFNGVNETLSGIPIDATFAYTSINDRIVQSPILIGMSTTLQWVIGRNGAAIYFKR